MELVIGILIGFVLACFGVSLLSVGTLRIDRSDPDDGPYMFLELEKNVHFVSSKKYVLLKVSNQNYISQQ